VSAAAASPAAESGKVPFKKAIKGDVTHLTAFAIAM